MESEYLDKIRAAGFTDVRSTATEYPGGKGIASAAVVAVKPGAQPAKLTFAAAPGATCDVDGNCC